MASGFSHAISDGEGISQIEFRRGKGTETLEVSGDPAAVAHVVDFAATIGASVTHDAELAIRVRNEEELEQALEAHDPELLVLAGTLDEVLELLEDVPAGKLAIAELASPAQEDIDELERAGMDAVIVRDAS